MRPNRSWGPDASPSATLPSPARRSALPPTEAAGAVLHAGRLAELAGGRVVRGDPGARAAGASTDTRTIVPGQAFFALRGERFDGHRFAADAARVGAAFVVVAEDALGAVDGVETTVVAVGDTVRALGAAAADVRRTSSIPWVATTGSVGKTTTKELVAAALGARGPVLKAPASYNNRIGVPLTILGLTPAHRGASIEIGTNAPGEVAELAHVVRPDVAVVTTVGPAHLERFGTVEAVAREKAALLASLAPGGVAVLPADCGCLPILRDRAPGRVVTFGLSRAADVRADEVGILADGRAWFSTGGLDVLLRLPGLANVRNALAALAAAEAAGVPRARAAGLLADVEALEGRGRRRQGHGVDVLDDSYNANPLSFAAALERLLCAPAAGRRWVVAGDMRELGPGAAALHEDLGALVARAGVAHLVATGRHAADLARGAAQGGMALSSIEQVPTAIEACSRARALARAGDLVLVKGSRAVGLEVVVEALAGGDG